MQGAGSGTLEVIGTLKPSKIKMSELIVEMQWEVLKVSNLIMNSNFDSCY
jgi:hypothetical protein